MMSLPFMIFLRKQSCGLLGTTTALGEYASGLNCGRFVNFWEKFTVSSTLRGVEYG